MKKLTSLFLAFLLVFTAAAMVIPASADGVKTVYISDAGDDAAAGAQDKPVKTLLAAYELLGAEGGTICLVGNLTVNDEEVRSICDYSASVSQAEVTITAINDSQLTFGSSCKGIWFYSDTVIENIAIHCAYTGYNFLFVANCHKLTFGENVEITKAESQYDYPLIYGGGYYSFEVIKPNMNAEIVVKSGHFGAIYGGGGTNTHADWGTHIDDVQGTTTIRVEGGVVGAIYAGGNGTVGTTEPVVSYGDVDITVTGGIWIGPIAASGFSSMAHIKGNVSVTVTGGNVAGVIKACNFSGDDDMVSGIIRLSCAEQYRAQAEGFADPSVALAAVQETTPAEDKQSIRFTATVNSLEYNGLGMKLEISYNDGEAKTKTSNLTSTTVYGSIEAAGETVTAAELGGNYLYALTVNNVPTNIGDIVFKVTPFYINSEGATVYATAYLITYTNGVYVNCTAA